MRYKIVVEYRGTAYCGWQRQKNGLSVQEVLESAFFKLFGRAVSLTGSGRTDAGVHALGQVAHFDAQTSIPAEKIPYAVNSLLPDDVKVRECEGVDDSFNARFSAKRKTYRYSIYAAAQESPMRSLFAANTPLMPDVSAMQSAAKYIVGTHDFKAFCATGGKNKTTVRTIYDLRVEQSGGNIDIYVTGDGFLYNMVRIIAGTLLYAGLNKITADDLPDIINSRDRTRAGKTLPPQGLCLISVIY